MAAEAAGSDFDALGLDAEGSEFNSLALDAAGSDRETPGLDANGSDREALGGSVDILSWLGYWLVSKDAPRLDQVEQDEQCGRIPLADGPQLSTSGQVPAPSC